MKKLINKAWLPIKSRLDYKGELTDLQKKRLKVCSGCPHNSDNKGVKSLGDRLKIMLNQTLNFFTGVNATDESVCLLCGCQLIFKSSQQDKENMCELKKWDNLK
jgi:hypothetical protein